jgi:rhamnose utilization protein RhaD (predicted bifunctional aldolase and dehydrogenase)
MLRSEAARREHALMPGRELEALRELTASAGRNPLLAQGSTGNSSLKLAGILWIKASGKWMADALRDDIFIPLHLAEVTECLRRGMDPSVCYPRASLETAMHAALPHRVVLHVHCVNTIAWAVRNDALIQLDRRLEGLRWQWIPYVASGLPLSQAIEHVLSASPDKNLFVLGNHGLVIAGESAGTVESLLREVTERLSIVPRQSQPGDYAALLEISQDSPWDLPEDDGVHALGTDLISQMILAGGLLYPCQAIFSNATTPDLFRPIPYEDFVGRWQNRYCNRPLLIIQGRGVLVSRSIKPAELAMISGLVQVVQRLGVSAPLRYLTSAEVAAISSQGLYSYRERASQAR